MNYNNPTNPSVLFGGTWEPIGGRFLMGAGAKVGKNNRNDFGVIPDDQANWIWAAGETGGEYFHKLTVNEMPSHRHGMTGNNGGGGNNVYPFPITNGGVNWNSWNPTDAAGGDATHNNIPPYMAVYMWRRTA